MVCTISVVHAGGERYYLHLAREDYYTQGGEKPGRALGEGSELVGLTSPIVDGDKRVRDLFRGINPTDGSVLRKGAQTERVYRDKDGRERVSKPVAAYDFTLSVDKTVSVLWAVSDRETQQKISSILNHATERVAEYIDQHFAYTRVRTLEGKYELKKVYPIFLAFEHATSRELDPQKHVHLLLVNAGIRESGRGGAVHAQAFLHAHSPHRAKLTERFHEEVRVGLERELGVKTYYNHLAQGRSVAVAGVPPSLAQHFSKRRHQIKEALLPGDSSKQVQAKVLATRRQKLRDVRHEDLYSQWREVAREYGFDYRKVIYQDQKPFQQRERTEYREESANRSESTKALVPLQTGKREHEEAVLHEAKRDPKRDRERFRSFREYREEKWEERRSRPVPPRRPLSEQEAREQTFSFERLKAMKELRDIQSRESFERGLDKAFRKTRESSKRREERYQRKQLFLYVTGQISHDRYVRNTKENRELSRTKFGINVAYATWQISRKQQRYLLSKYGHTQKFQGLPRTRVGINLAYTTYQITNHQRLALLYHHRQLRAQDLQTPRERAKALLERVKQGVDRVEETARLVYDRAVERREVRKQQPNSPRVLPTRAKKHERDYERER
jgi:conjugative relaxase-like TrwC/TraI family protein